jgi:hypothetical protein
MLARVNGKKCFVTSVAIFAAVTAIDMVMNVVVLDKQYEAFASLWRPQPRMSTLFPLLFLGQAVFAYSFSWIYAQGFEPEKPALPQGLKFGLCVWPLFAVAGNLAAAPFINVPLRFFAFWIATGLVDCLVAGLVAARFYRPRTG